MFARLVEHDGGLNHIWAGAAKISDLMALIQTRAPRSAKTTLDQMVVNKTLSTDGYNFVLQNVDGFHDRSFPPTGEPDICTARSVTRCIQTSQEVSYSGSGQWDLDIFFIPLTPGVGLTPAHAGDPKAEFAPYTFLADGQFNSSTPSAITTNLASTMNVIQAPTGVDWKTDTSGVATQLTTIGLPNTVCNDQFRLVGCAYEVTNNTPELYRGGSVSCYRSPSNPSQTYTWFSNWNSTATTTSTVTAKEKRSSVTMTKTEEVAAATSPQGVVGPILSLPPSNLTDINFLPGSLTWGAEEGVYQIVTRNDVANPPLNVASSFGQLRDPYGSSTLGFSQTRWVPLSTETIIGSARCYSNYALPYDCCGCKFTGLDQHSTFTIVVRYFVETFPTPSNEVLASLSRPSPKYDPMAFDIYSACMDALPVACTKGENPLGEWFTKVVREVGKLATPVGDAIGNFFPPARGIGRAITSAAESYAGSESAEPKKKKAKKNKGNPPPPTQRPAPVPGTTKSSRRRARAKALTALAAKGL